MDSNYQDRIPNNVGLGANRTLQRALEHWQPEFLNWWHGLGPSDFNASSVYLRTARRGSRRGPRCKARFAPRPTLFGMRS